MLHIDKQKHFLNGLKDGIPIILGYFPVGVAFGVLAYSSGINPIGVALLSLILFAGSGQFIAVAMLSSLSGLFTIVLTIFLINFRHFLMSSSLSRYFKKVPNSQLLFISHFITDESFAISINKAKNDEKNFNKYYFLGVELAGYCSWFIFTVTGCLLGSFVTNTKALGLDFALCAMFIGLLAIMVKNKKALFCCVIAGGFSVFLSLIGVEYLNVIIASIVASIIMVMIDSDDD